MSLSFSAIVVGLVFIIVLLGGSFLFVCVIRALLKYIRAKDMREEQQAVKTSLGEALKSHRMQCRMTQEFVADAIGVSRQAVSKWETGLSDPSTSNLIALAKLFKISPEELLHEIC